LIRRKHALIGPDGQGFAMGEPRHWKSALLVTGPLGFTLQGHADDRGKPRGEPPQDGSRPGEAVPAHQIGIALNRDRVLGILTSILEKRLVSVSSTSG